MRRRRGVVGRVDHGCHVGDEPGDECRIEARIAALSHERAGAVPTRVLASPVMTRASRSAERAIRRVQITRRARAALGWSIVATVLLPRIPVLSALWLPLLWLSTVAHELGHGVTALAAGGSFTHFVIHPDGSGTAYFSMHGGDLAGALVAAGGLVGPAIVAALWFVLGHRPLGARLGLALFGAAFVAAAALVADPGFTQIYLGSLGGLALLAAMLLSAGWAQGTLVFLAVQLALSVYTRSDYLFTEVALPSGAPSDVAVIARHLGGPYWAWGLACGLFSALVLVLGLRWYLRGDTRVALADLRR